MGWDNQGIGARWPIFGTRWLVQVDHGVRYPLPVIEDMPQDLAKAKVFPRVEARNGYSMLFVTNHSANKPFDTPFGNTMGNDFHSKWMLYQKTSRNNCFKSLRDWIAVHDDMIIYGTGTPLQKPQQTTREISEQMRAERKKEIATAYHRSHWPLGDKQRVRC